MVFIIIIIIVIIITIIIIIIIIIIMWGNSWNPVHITVQGVHILYFIVHTQYAPHLILSIFPSVFHP